MSLQLILLTLAASCFPSHQAGNNIVQVVPNLDMKIDLSSSNPSIIHQVHLLISMSKHHGWECDFKTIGFGEAGDNVKGRSLTLSRPGTDHPIGQGFLCLKQMTAITLTVDSAPARDWLEHTEQLFFCTGQKWAVGLAFECGAFFALRNWFEGPVSVVRERRTPPTAASRGPGTVQRKRRAEPCH